MITAPDVAIDELHPHPRNYQRHPDDQLDEIGRSIVEHGYFRNIVVANDGTILAGHGVVEAARKLGHTHVPVLRLDVDPDSPQALKVIVADNEISRLADVDDRALTDMLREIMHEAETSLAGTGFTPEQLAALAMITRTADELNDLDAAAEWVGLPEFVTDDTVRALLSISFESYEDRAEFVKRHADVVPHFAGDESRTWSARWPARERDDLASIRFEPADDGTTP